MLCSINTSRKQVHMLKLAPPPTPTSLKHEFYGLTSGFTRLIMNTKYVYHDLISLHVNLAIFQSPFPPFKKPSLCLFYVLLQLNA